MEGVSYNELRPMNEGESPGSAGAESEYDPRLEQKIEQIKLNLRTGSNTNSQANTNTHAGGVTSIESTSHNRNVSKLEEVLKRQRDRLDHIQGQFALSRDEIRELSPERNSNAINSDDDDRVHSASTNHLEKAYEDLEREI